MKKLIGFLFLTAILSPWELYSQNSIVGCTDPAALNYSAEAEADDGSCCYSNYLTLNSASDLFFQFSEIAPDGASFQTYYGWNYSENGGVCLPQGCYTLTVYGEFVLDEIAFTITDSQGNVLVENTTSGGVYWQFYSNNGEVPGCMYASACNYDPQATCGNAGLCNFTDCGGPSPYGCTDPTAPNYNADALIDDGSCCEDASYYTLQVDGVELSSLQYQLFASNWLLASNGGPSSWCLPEGCYTLVASDLFGIAEFTIQVVNALGEVVASGNAQEASNGISFSLNALAGCTDLNACNYNPQATCADTFLCDYSCFGCTNPDALNYDEEATEDDGSCCVNTFTIEADGPFQWFVTSYAGGQNSSGYYPESNSFCINDGCYSFEVWNYMNSNLPVNWQIIDSEGNTAYSGQSGLWLATEEISINAVFGCVDASACNYDPLATCGDYSLCAFDCYGCTDPSASNFDSEATLDNGSCCFDSWFTIDSNAGGYWYVYDQTGQVSGSGSFPDQNGFCQGDGCFSVIFYNAFGTEDDLLVAVTNSDGEVIGSAGFDENFGGAAVIFNSGSISGCTDVSACNYNPEANCSDYSACTYDCYGCTNPEAANFDADATIDDGSCCTTTWYTIELSAEAYWSVSSADYTTYQWGSYPQDNGFCSIGDCFSLSVWTYDGSAVDYTISDNDGVVSSGSIDYYDFGTVISLDDAVVGCMDPSSCNFNPDATCSNWYSCDYSCYGCTNAEAPNYNPAATLDDGSCCLTNWYTLSMSGMAYWYITDAAFTSISGVYPGNSGFCMDASCFSLMVYSYDNAPVEVSITDGNGNTVFTGVAYPFAYQSLSVSLNDEVAGCTDPLMCNYNPEATCNDGSCSFDCGGCTDESALNFDAFALYEDGSCFYFVQPPLVGMGLMEDEENDQYYVVMNMMDTGNGAPYVMRNDFDESVMMIEESGQYMAGPYPCDQSVAFELQSMPAGLEVYLNAEMEGLCASSVNVNEGSRAIDDLVAYPNPANDMVTIAGIDSNRARIILVDLSGRVVLNEMGNSANGQIELNLGTLEAGLYIVHASTDSGSQSIRLVLE